MVRPFIAPLLILAALAPPSEAVARGGEPSRKNPPPVAAADPAGDDAPPPGSAADVALWRAGRAATEAIVVERARTGTLQVTIGSSKLLERLEAAAALAGPRAGPALLAVRERLLKAWQRDYHVVTRQWPVDPTRGCGYPLLAFDSALRLPAGDDSGVLGSARGELRACVEKAQGAVKALADANRVLGAARAEAERALRPPGKAPGGREDEQHEAAEKHETLEKHEAAESAGRGKDEG